MSKKIEIYEKALEFIRVAPNLDTAQAAATKALEDGETEGEDRGALVARIADVAIAKALVFGSAEEVAEACNAAGLLSARGKPWSKATITRYMGDVRALLQEKLLAAAGAVPVMDSVPAADEPTTKAETAGLNDTAVVYEERLSPANVTTITEEVVAEPVPEPSPAIDLELEEIEELTRNL